MATDEGGERQVRQSNLAHPSGQSQLPLESNWPLGAHVWPVSSGPSVMMGLLGYATPSRRALAGLTCHVLGRVLPARRLVRAAPPPQRWGAALVAAPAAKSDSSERSSRRRRELSGCNLNLAASATTLPAALQAPQAAADPAQGFRAQALV